MKYFTKKLLIELRYNDLQLTGKRPRTFKPRPSASRIPKSVREHYHSRTLIGSTLRKNSFGNHILTVKLLDGTKHIWERQLIRSNTVRNWSWVRKENADGTPAASNKVPCTDAAERSSDSGTGRTTTQSSIGT